MKTYVLYPPSIPEDVERLSFSSNLAGGDPWVFTFLWLNEAWSAFITLPDETVREAGCVPGVLNWTGYSDYAIQFDYANADVIGLNDISSISITVVYR
jgi:hypothetical protein